MKKKILFVEDEPHVLELVAYRLRNSGYEVLTAADGIKGLELTKNENPDLVILDLNIPGLSGEEVCR